MVGHLLFAFLCCGFLVFRSSLADSSSVQVDHLVVPCACSSPSAARCSSAHQLSHVNQIEFLSSVGRWWLSFTLFLFFGTWWIVDHLCLLLLVLVVVID
ncbi:hypothetical protein PC116_g24612 [Phytophthora cactorum]|uniref:Uncharacterized protein n=1 Tax=Phytophthora cactorum TaxID=29920 RepID=A0A8T1JV63_9STRA|nr:hypothetical protein PC114_g22579 [Phytophthora cactorum]KAG2899103.1 hypothetical protein PC117_g22365 [Phytophthora cactorum]KAG4042374.1 hypothetical protein PC123_g22129 [Phytophthora cactorum]KAG4226988.1 hypothetical protein PC116_g24612 [Phytophthora cactorum]